MFLRRTAICSIKSIKWPPLCVTVPLKGVKKFYREYGYKYKNAGKQRLPPHKLPQKHSLLLLAMVKHRYLLSVRSFNVLYGFPVTDRLQELFNLNSQSSYETYLFEVELASKQRRSKNPLLISSHIMVKLHKRLESTPESMNR